eukprot:12914364-Prorocentrum_lima.AAC.1
MVAGIVESEEEEDDAIVQRNSRHSTKRAFAAKCLAPLLGYGSSYEIMHFLYDFNLWSTIGAKKATSI